MTPPSARSTVATLPRSALLYEDIPRMSSVPAFWQHCLASFRQELTPQQFNTWIRPLAIVQAPDGYRVLAPNRFVLQWVKERFAQRINELAKSGEGQPVNISLGVNDGPADPAATLPAAEPPRPVAAAVGDP